MDDPFLRPPEVFLRSFTRANQISQRLPLFVGNGDERQLARSKVAPQLRGVPPVGLHPLAWLLRRQRRRGHLALVASLRQPSIQLVPARTGLVDDANLAIQSLQIRKQAPVAFLVRYQLELFRRLSFIPSVLRYRPLVCVIVDPNPVDNLHDPFLLVCGSVPLRVQPTKRYIERAGHSIISNGPHGLRRGSRLRVTLPRRST